MLTKTAKRDNAAVLRNYTWMIRKTIEAIIAIKFPKCVACKKPANRLVDRSLTSRWSTVSGAGANSSIQSIIRPRNIQRGDGG
jgi:hypothetical protein